MFRATEELNRRALLAVAEERPGGRLLDCGCGDGAFTRRLADRVGAAEVHGVEKVEWRVREATARGVLVAAVDLEASLPYPDDHFDVVHANQIIEHLADPDRFLREVRRLLHPAGYALLSTNNLASWHNVVSLLFGFQPPSAHASTEVLVGNPVDPYHRQPFVAREDSHQRVFSYQALRELARHHGFRVLDYRSAGYYPLPPAAARAFTWLDARHGAFLVAKLGAGP
jgi:SAM-dependent methyltransferase